LKSKRVEFLGRVPDGELYRYYGECKAFLALAIDEDFGMTPVEAMAAGRPVIAFRGGGYLESVIEARSAPFDKTQGKSSGQGPTGEFFNEPTVESLVKVLKRFNPKKYKREDCIAQAKKFNKTRFKREIKEFIKEKL